MKVNNQIIIDAFYTCPICTEFTANDEWAKPAEVEEDLEVEVLKWH